MGEKVPADLKGEVETKIEALKKVKDSGTIEELKGATEELSQSLQKIGSQVYQQGEQSQP